MTTPPQSGQPEFPPPPPASLPEFPPAPPAPAQPAKPKRGLKVLLRFAIPIVIGLIVLGVRVFSGGSFSSASHDVGDCLKGNSNDADSISSVDCGPDANYKVSGVVKDQNELSVKFSSACDPFPNTDATFWYGKSGGTGTLYCLENLKNPGERMPAVGDCLKRSGTDDAKKIECGPEADYKVAAIEDAPSIAIPGDTSTCASVPTAKTVLRWSKSGGLLPTTKALCLEELKSP
ncbi:hypothetical protein SAMN05421504_1011151 [Amycolatopsis xylanica]|uniref:Uncharacterized protein n=1 Tax=Amycolatopsis xylanica TaxID=589385 RepID=A0A1H2V967_9PSEU|nr:hypothetical protein [Amycolatopsis xylanica]SDW64862.1 hypothetical protein SAMN05421504_1011151 [Amycolatopsis xylanica]